MWPRRRPNETNHSCKDHVEEVMEQLAPELSHYQKRAGQDARATTSVVIWSYACY
jgi:hypothetical protein